MLLLGAMAGAGRCAGAAPRDDALVIAAGQHVAGDVATIAQDIRVDGMVDGDVTSWNGAITIAGSVGGDVVSYGGAVTVAPTGRVAGHILASGGVLQPGTGAVVAGQMIERRRRRGAGEPARSAESLPLQAPPDDALGRALFGVALAVLLAAFCLLYIGLLAWPHRPRRRRRCGGCPAARWRWAC